MLLNKDDLIHFSISRHLADDSHNASNEAIEAVEEAENGVLPAKRLRVTEIDISRYDQEFVEIKEIASGSFGKVKVARHCLDGMVYAIKVIFIACRITRKHFLLWRINAVMKSEPLQLVKDLGSIS